jgi:hypothetical protein
MQKKLKKFHIWKELSAGQQNQYYPTKNLFEETISKKTLAIFKTVF